ncbi:uncharacterized protein LOC115222332 [Octopus sinensis]|uniref:ATP-dependent DNA helicase n=1 Tax=Octopus sinensis TaxID=2607531 RepID=A0A6P7TDI4_9MOLL|nr:uncharacterized protein LOC115222332 [Octopus sinensis]
MSHRGAMEALGNTLQDIGGNNKFMGRFTLLLSGEFRQTLPVILRQTRSDEIKAWNKVLKFSFNTNMPASLHGDQCGKQFSTCLLQLGNEKVPLNGNGDISLAHIAIMMNSPAQLKNKVLPDLSDDNNLHKWLCERAILNPQK